jgi:hypothetical protein
VLQRPLVELQINCHIEQGFNSEVRSRTGTGRSMRADFLVGEGWALLPHPTQYDVRLDVNIQNINIHIYLNINIDICICI